jgi:hypothetical protein
MTEIERMWDKAQKDTSHQAVNGTIASESKVYCTFCSKVKTKAQYEECVAMRLEKPNGD